MRILDDDTVAIDKQSRAMRVKEYLQRLQIRKERPSQLVIITGSTEPRRKLQRLLRYGRAICELTSRTTNSGETRQRTGTPLVPIPLVT